MFLISEIHFKLDSALTVREVSDSLICVLTNLRISHIISLSNFQTMNRFLVRALPVTAVIVDVLLIIDITKDIVNDYRKKHPSTTTTKQDENPGTATEPEPTNA